MNAPGGHRRDNYAVGIKIPVVGYRGRAGHMAMDRAEEAGRIGRSRRAGGRCDERKHCRKGRDVLYRDGPNPFSHGARLPHFADLIMRMTRILIRHQLEFVKRGAKPACTCGLPVRLGGLTERKRAAIFRPWAQVASPDIDYDHFARRGVGKLRTLIQRHSLDPNNPAGHRTGFFVHPPRPPAPIDGAQGDV